MIKNKIIFNNEATDWMFDLEKAEGCFIWTKDGKKLIDFTSAWNVTNLGWNNPEIREAIITQAGKNVHNILWSSDEIQIKYSKELTDVLPSALWVVARATGGTEANEEALKTARAYTKRKKIIGFKDTYHGQSFGTMAIGYRPEYVADISPLVPDFVQIDFPPASATIKKPEELLEEFFLGFEKILKNEDVATIVAEAGIITGWGSTYVAPKGFLKGIRRLTEKYGTLLILDEVGTGFSRLGKLFGMEIEEVVPDIVTFAKGLSNGAGAIGAMVTKEEIAESTIGQTNLTSTFGWNSVAVAAASKTLEIHLRDEVWKKANSDGTFLMSSLKRELLQHPKVGDVRGMGMEIGIDFVKDKISKTPDPDFAHLIVEKAFKNGLHLVVGDGGNIQLMPPLVIDRKLLNKGIEILISCLD